MKYYQLPISVETMKHIESEEYMIDMSDLRFPVDPPKQLRCAFIFLRNITADLNLDFSKCTFETKEEFLLFYLFDNNIDLDVQLLDTTWLNILLHRFIDHTNLPSILNDDDVRLFIDRNADLIDELHRFTISLPVYSIYRYGKFLEERYNQGININDFDKSDFTRMNLHNFANLSFYDEFIMLIQPMDDVKPAFYTNYFDGKDWIMRAISDNLPFTKLLNIATAPDDEKNRILKNIEDVVNVKGDSDD